jgi:hypothetical protein
MVCVFHSLDSLSQGDTISRKKKKRNPDEYQNHKLPRCPDCGIILRSVRVNKGQRNKTHKKATGIHFCVYCGHMFDTMFFDLNNHGIDGRKCYVKLKDSYVSIPFTFSETDRTLKPDGNFSEWKNSHKSLLSKLK